MPGLDWDNLTDDQDVYANPLSFLFFFLFSFLPFTSQMLPTSEEEPVKDQ